MKGRMRGSMSDNRGMRREGEGIWASFVRNI